MRSFYFTVRVHVLPVVLEYGVCVCCCCAFVMTVLAVCACGLQPNQTENVSNTCVVSWWRRRTILTFQLTLTF